MFGYVRPSDRRLSEQEREAFRAAYCGLCHALGKRYGLAGRMILNYDLTFLAMVLSDGAGRTECRHCAIHPVKGCPCAEGDPALNTAADMSVILTYWQLRVGHAVPQLPVGQYHAHVRRRVQRRVACRTAALPQRMYRTAPHTVLPCSVRQHHRQKSQIIVQDHPPHQAVPRTQRVAQPAVGGAERLTVRRRQPVIRRPHIAEHLSEHP